MLGFYSISAAPLSGLILTALAPAQPNAADELKHQPLIIPPHPLKQVQSKGKKKKIQAFVHAPVPTPEDIQALTDALLFNIPLDPNTQVDFNELRQLIAIEQARLEQLRQEMEEEDLATTLVLTWFHESNSFKRILLAPKKKNPFIDKT